MSIKKQIEERPWGMFEQFIQNEECTVKLLTVNPHEALSLQFHEQREEYWRILNGSGRIIIGEDEIYGNAGDEFFIPKKTLHRISIDEESLTILEISIGHFDEKDIVRIKDKYSRANL